MEQGTTLVTLDTASPERFVSLRRALGVSTFGINLMLLNPGERGRIHAHERQEEVYLVLEGTLTVSVEGEEQDVAAGQAIRVAPQVRRQVLNRGPGRVAVVALGSANAHVGRDGLSYGTWEETEPRPPQEIPLPEDLPASELRTA